MDSNTENTVAERPSLNLMDLPTELHLHISSYLPYPDALALKHTCRHFYYLVYTGVHLKIDWLVSRFERKLECPMEKCSFRTDEQFCNWRIRRIIARRRRHLECRPGKGGCMVIEGRTCTRAVIPWWIRRNEKLTMFGRGNGWRDEGHFYLILAPSSQNLIDIFSVIHGPPFPPDIRVLDLDLKVCAADDQVDLCSMDSTGCYLREGSTQITQSHSSLVQSVSMHMDSIYRLSNALEYMPGA